MIQLVILDVEGVLTPPENSRKSWSLNNFLNIRQFVRNQRPKIVCILCTGRQVSYGEAVIQALDFFFPFPKNRAQEFADSWKTELLSWPSVFENGACFYDPMAKKLIKNLEMTEAQLNHIREIRAKVVPSLIRDTGCQLEPGKIFSISLNPPLRPGSRTKRVSTNKFRPLVDEAMQNFKNYVNINHSASAIDITPKGITKASAVNFLLKNTGVKPEEVLGVGDTAADEEWLTVVGWSASPANGKGKLKHVNYFSPYEVTDGLFDILKNLEAHNYRKVG